MEFPLLDDYRQKWQFAIANCSSFSRDYLQFAIHIALNLDQNRMWNPFRIVKTTNFKLITRVYHHCILQAVKRQRLRPYRCRLLMQGPGAR